MLRTDKIKLTFLSLIATTLVVAVVYCVTTIGTTDYLALI